MSVQGNLKALVTLVLSAMLVPGSLAQGNTTTPAPGNGTLRLRVKINGVFVDISNCTLSDFGDVSCNSNLQHDVTVTRAEPAPGTESWVVAMIFINLGLLLVFMVIVIAIYIVNSCKSRQRSPEDQALLPPEGQEPYAYEPQGYEPQYYRAKASGGKKVISVGLVKPGLPAETIMA